VREILSLLAGTRQPKNLKIFPSFRPYQVRLTGLSPSLKSSSFCGNANFFLFEGNIENAAGHGAVANVSELPSMGRVGHLHIMKINAVKQLLVAN